LLTGKITGTGSYLPDFVMKNSDFEKIVETSDEWIVTRTGISERHIGTGMENWEMGLYAAQNALESAGEQASAIDHIIGVTVSPDYFYPALSNIIQWKLGASNASCFDVAAGCSGFVVGMDVACQYIRSGKAKKVLVVSAEALTKTVDFTDRSTCVLFGDGAGAVLLEATESGGIINTYTMSEPDPQGLLACRALKPNNPYVKPDSKTLFNDLSDKFLRMGGREVYKFAIRVLPAAIKKVLEGTGILLDEIKYIVPHQANLRIINYVTEHLGIKPDRMYVNIDKCANTSSASMPIALDEMVRKGLLKPHDKVIFAAFGAGLTYGAILLEW
jgi:3-oxoacyl-[acyl-carrier-protein] synthase III